MSATVLDAEPAGLRVPPAPTVPHTRRLHLRSLGEVERHAADPRRPEGYARLLADFGIDAAAFATVSGPPRLVLAEQTGCWLWADDLVRHRLIETVAPLLGWRAGSGALALAADAFDWRDTKRFFVTLRLHPALGDSPLLGASYLRHHRHRAYHALAIDDGAHRRMAAIFEAALTLVDAAAVSCEAFAREARGLFARGVPAGVRPLLPADTRRRTLHELAAALRDHDLDAARRPLAVARRELHPGVAWDAYWRRVDGAFLGTAVGDLGPLFNRFLLAVGDPVRMARQLACATGRAAAASVPVAAIFTAEEKYRMVRYDPADGSFFYRPRHGERSAISWHEVRDAAARGRTGGPSGVLEYLMMAAAGIYLVADPEDGRLRFERQAAAIHRYYTGLPFPYVAVERSLGGDHGLLPVYGPEFAATCHELLERFLR